MTGGPDPSIPYPEAPAKPVVGFYRCPGSGAYWLYYDGSAWVAEPVQLPWYRRPMAGVRGRPPAWSLGALLVTVALVAIGITFLH